MRQQPVLLFDGICNLCNGAVNFVIKRDKKAILKFAPLQSEVAKKLLEDFNLSHNEMKSFILIENNESYIKSTAALKVCRYLKNPWPLMYGFIIVPKFIRDGIYNWIAHNRYRWFGKKETCMIPTPELRERFLNETV